MLRSLAEIVTRPGAQIRFHVHLPMMLGRPGGGLAASTSVPILLACILTYLRSHWRRLSPFPPCTQEVTNNLELILWGKGGMPSPRHVSNLRQDHPGYLRRSPTPDVYIARLGMWAGHNISFSFPSDNTLFDPALLDTWKSWAVL